MKDLLEAIYPRKDRPDYVMRLEPIQTSNNAVFQFLSSEEELAHFPRAPHTPGGTHTHSPEPWGEQGGTPENGQTGEGEERRRSDQEEEEEGGEEAAQPEEEGSTSGVGTYRRNRASRHTLARSHTHTDAHCNTLSVSVSLGGGRYHLVLPVW